MRVITPITNQILHGGGQTFHIWDVYRLLVSQRHCSPQASPCSARHTPTHPIRPPGVAIKTQGSTTPPLFTFHWAIVLMPSQLSGRWLMHQKAKCWTDEERNCNQFVCETADAGLNIIAQIIWSILDCLLFQGLAPIWEYLQTHSGG